jgi:hypothetical protein
MKYCRFPLAEILNKILASEGEDLKTALNNDFYLYHINLHIIQSSINKIIVFNVIKYFLNKN